MKKRIEEWKVGRLKRNPGQGANFHDLDEVKLKELADDMRRNGQTTPIEVTEDGGILNGHGRLAAAEELGWETVTVWVRTDLKTEEARERRHVEANSPGRQLDHLDQLRNAKRLLELKYGRAPGALSQSEQRELIRKTAEKIGRSPRHVQRLLNIVNTPMAVQRAFQEGRLKLTDAEKVARLKKAVQDSITQSILGGADPAAVVAGHLPQQRTAGRGTHLGTHLDGQYAKFFEEAVRTVEVVGGREGEVLFSTREFAREVSTLEEVIPMVKKIVKRLKRLEGGLGLGGPS